MKPNDLRCFCPGLRTVSLIIAWGIISCQARGDGPPGDRRNESLALPPADTEQGLPLNKALSSRRSVRRFGPHMRKIHHAATSGLLRPRVCLLGRTT